MAKIKICGLKSEDDIKMVNELKPDYCGFIIDFPKSHRSKTPDEVRKLVSLLQKEEVVPVGVFVNEDVEIVASLINDGTISIAQLHGNEDENYISQLRKLIDNKSDNVYSIDNKDSDVKIIKAFQIKSEADFEIAKISKADMILLDQGQGSGETFDWSLIKTEEICRKWILAGGLNEKNIALAIDKFSPYAVDLSSAVETDNKKDYHKVKNMIELVRKTGNGGNRND
ncbi:MAG: phosphoribosylanthranilate isomerase [Lachnospiraceae bacterium]|nr:phosphoribosylanthranilate isomerase [Lachnospiraceae bacterium]